jgi:hypothetical protein
MDLVVQADQYVRQLLEVLVILWVLKDPQDQADLLNLMILSHLSLQWSLCILVDQLLQ